MGFFYKEERFFTTHFKSLDIHQVYSLIPYRLKVLNFPVLLLNIMLLPTLTIKSSLFSISHVVILPLFTPQAMLKKLITCLI